MIRRTVLSSLLSKNQKDSLVGHSIWHYEDLENEKKEVLCRRLELGSFINPSSESEKRSKSLLKYITGYESIDKYISPYLAGVVTEICGLPGVGRTTFCLKVASGLPESKETLWIDTEGSLSLPKDLKLNHLRILDHIQFFALVHRIPSIIDSMGDKIGLIVVDSVAASLRGQPAESGIERTSILWELVKMFRKIAFEKGIAVLITNQMAAKPYFGHHRTLGESWGHAATHCLEVKRIGNSKRIIKIAKSPNIPHFDVSFD